MEIGGPEVQGHLELHSKLKVNLMYMKSLPPKRKGKYMKEITWHTIVHFKIGGRKILPYSRTHMGDLLEEEREGTEKGTEKGAEIGFWAQEGWERDGRWAKPVFYKGT